MFVSEYQSYEPYPINNIKFRGKSIEDGSWVIGFYIKYRARTFIAPISSIRGGYNEKYGDWVEVDRETVSPYTMVNDEHGVEIYGGDICHITQFLDETILEITFVVQHHHKEWKYKTMGKVDMQTTEVSDVVEYGFLSWDLPIHQDYADTYLDVIGNVWDTPELMKREGVNYRKTETKPKVHLQTKQLQVEESPLES